MIVSLSQEVCQLVQENDTLEKIKNDANSIKDTFEALQKVKAIAEQVSAYVIITRERLPEQEVQEVYIAIERALHDLAVSKKNFEEESRQVKSLSYIRTRLQEVIKDIKEQWHHYAEKQTHELLELLVLVSYLPEIASQQHIYHMLKAKLQQAIDEPPDTVESLAQFDQCLQELKQRLEDITGLSPAVKLFLQRTLNGQATLEDLTDDVLTWCRQGQHAQAFAIKFVK
jgi:hypothetical protein